MKLGRSLPEIAAELKRQQAGKRDYLADSRKIRFDSEGTTIGARIVGVDGGSLIPVGRIAHEQFASHTGIPKVYYDRMLTQAPDLLTRNLNHWLETDPQTRLVRTMDGQIRAFLSDRYRPLDNLDLAEAVLPALNDLQASVVSAEITDRRFYLQATTERISGEVKKGDIVQAGIIISNSEVGAGALSIQDLDYRLVCLNGAIVSTAVRKAHLGRGRNGDDLIESAREFYRDETRKLDDAAFFAKVRDTAGAVFNADRFNKRIEQYRTGAARMIEAAVPAVLELTAKRFDLNETEQESVLTYLIRGGDLSQWGLGNAITRAAEDASSYDRAVEMESAGGQVLMLSGNDWKAVGQL